MPENITTDNIITDEITIRASSLSSYSDCPRRSAARMFKRGLIDSGYEFRQTEPGIGAVIGTSVHEGVRYIHETTDTLPNIIEIGIEKFRSQIENGILYDDTSPGPNIAEKQIQQISKAYFYIVAPKTNPVYVEHELSAAMSGNVRLTGHPDNIETDTIRDLKTGTKAGKNYGQMGGYSLLAGANNIICGSPQLIIDWIPRVSKNKPSAEPVEIHYDLVLCEDEAWLIMCNIINNYKSFLESGDIKSFPANYMSNMCSAKYCIAHGTDFCPLSG